MLNVKFVLLCSIRTSFLSFHKIIRCFLFCFVFFNLARSTIYFIWRFKHLPLRRLKYIKVEYLYVGICLSCSPSLVYSGECYLVHSSFFSVPALPISSELTCKQHKDECCRPQHDAATLLSAPTRRVTELAVQILHTLLYIPAFTVLQDLQCAVGVFLVLY